MGQKVNPNGMRLGIVRDWNARWYAESKDYSNFLLEDIQIRNLVRKKLAASSVSKVYIERLAKAVQVTIHTARPGAVIGKKGEAIDQLRAEIEKIERSDKRPVSIAIEEIRKPELDAQLVADGIAQQLEKRIQFRRAMKRAVSNAMRAGAEGVKVMISGRLNGADIARSEWYREGRVPLHTFRADVDYAVAEGLTTYGQIGVKVWIFKGEVIGRHYLDEKSEPVAKRKNRSKRN